MGSNVTSFTTRAGRLLWGSVAWLAFLLVTLPVLVLLIVVPGQARRRRLVRGGSRLIARLGGVPLRVQGLERLPPGPCVVVANHASYLDGMILTAVLPPRFAFVIKREMTRVPVAHFLLRRVGSEFIDRESGGRGTGDARRIIKRATGGHSLVFFPEGTFRAQPGLGRFRLGAFNAALKGGMPVVPVVIRGSREMLPAEVWLPRRGPLEVHVHPPVEATSGERAGELAGRCRAIMLAGLGEPDLENPDAVPWPASAPSA